MAPLPRPKPSMIPTRNFIHCPFSILWCPWSVHNVEDSHLQFDEWYKKHIKAYKIQALEHQEDPPGHVYPECAPSWTINETFQNVF